MKVQLMTAIRHFIRDQIDRLLNCSVLAAVKVRNGICMSPLCVRVNAKTNTKIIS